MKPKLTVMEAVLAGLDTKWMSALDMQQYVKRKTGKFCTDSNITARIRECRKITPVTGKWFYERGRQIYRYVSNRALES